MTGIPPAERRSDNATMETITNPIVTPKAQPKPPIKPFLNFLRLSPFLISGPEGVRTPDLFNAIEARYQLRHGPIQSDYIKSNCICRSLINVELHTTVMEYVDGRGLEPLTSSTSKKRSNQLS